MKTRILFVISTFILAVLASACGPLWQVKKLLSSPGTPSSTPNILPPTPLLVTETQVFIPPTSTPVTPAATAATLPVVLTPDIIHINMLSDMEGWALGETYILCTSDGGRTWLNATPSGVTDIGLSSSSFFRDIDTAWFILSSGEGTSGTIFRSIDGGINWTSNVVPFSSGSLQFIDTRNGWILVPLGAAAGSQAVALYQTSDGGVSWTQVYTNDPNVSGSSESLPLAGQKSGVTFLDPAHGWVTGSEPMDGFFYLYTTVDYGHTWMHQEVNLPVGFETAQAVVEAPRFFSITEGLMAVRLNLGTSATVFYITHDSGLTWKPTFQINVVGHTSIASLTDVFVWDGSSMLYVSHDSGLTWSEVNTNVNVPDTLIQFQFIDALTGWMLTENDSNHHTLYKTVDGGAIWTVIIP